MEDYQEEAVLLSAEVQDRDAQLQALQLEVETLKARLLEAQHDRLEAAAEAALTRTALRDLQEQGRCSSSGRNSADWPGFRWILRVFMTQALLWPSLTQPPEAEVCWADMHDPPWQSRNEVNASSEVAWGGFAVDTDTKPLLAVDKLTADLDAMEVGTQQWQLQLPEEDLEPWTDPMPRANAEEESRASSRWAAAAAAPFGLVLGVTSVFRSL